MAGDRQEGVPKWGASLIYAPQWDFVNTVYHNSPRFGTFAENDRRLLYTFPKVVVVMNRIRDLRLAQGMSQADLAEMLNCARTAVSKYENGLLDIGSPTICRLCDIFGCTADYLLGRSTRPDPELSPEEEQLLAAWAIAPDEIRAIIRTALGPYQEDADGAAAPTA